jgi:peroxiredoxin
VELQEGTPKTVVNIKDVFAGKKGVLFAVPGAFTPGCSNVCEMIDAVDTACYVCVLAGYKA